MKVEPKFNIPIPQPRAALPTRSMHETTTRRGPEARSEQLRPEQRAIDSRAATIRRLNIPERTPARPLDQIRVSDQTFVNAEHNLSFTPQAVFAPNNNIEELVAIARFADEHELKLKAMGSLHSWSQAAVTDGVAIVPTHMVSLNPVNKAFLRAGISSDGLFTFGAGTTLKDIDLYLWAQGKSLPVMGGFDGQTIAGVFPTGTHGSVLKYAGLSDIIKGIDLVRADGKKVRLEPKDGITDVLAFRRSHPDWLLMQDDDAFHASLLSVGTMGVTHSVTLATVDKFYMREKTTLTTRADFARIMANENVYNLMDNDTHPPQPTTQVFPGHPVPAYHAEDWWNIHTDTMVHLSRVKVSAQEQAQLEANEPWEMSKPQPLGFIDTLRAKAGYVRGKVQLISTQYFGPVLNFLDAVAQKLRLTPWFVDLALKQTIDASFTNRSYNVFLLGQGESDIPAQAGTLSVPLRGDQYLAAMAVMRQIAQYSAQKYGIYQTAPISLRYVKKSEALLGEPEDACKFEIIFSGDSAKVREDSQKLYSAYYWALRQAFGDNVRVHFGQHQPTGFTRADLNATYPNAERFRQIQHAFDPHGRMLNDWQTELFS